MILTKELEKEIKAVMDDYWNSYFEGNLDHWANYLVNNYRNIGGTEEEIWNSKNEILDYTHKIIDQMVGQSEIRNKQVQIIPYEPYFMVHEFVDIYIKINDNWTFYQKFRLSSLIQKIGTEWKVLHQHGSYPDSKTQEGEAFAFDEVKIENKKLREAIKRRTIELEEKNRELEIEAAVERVRARAMAMHHSDELSNVLSILFEQFDVLGICPVYSQLSLLDLNANTFIFRCTGKFGRRVIAEQTVDIDSLDIVKQVVEKWKNSEPNSINELYFEKEVIPELFELFKEIRLATPAEALPHVEDFPDGLYVTEGNCQFGYMGFAHARKATEDEKVIVLKFATEFGRLYQRFLDLQKAEAQSREAQIELALERVRARTMAMQKSEELPDTSFLLFQQMKELGLTAVQNSIAIIKEDEGFVELSTTVQGHPEPSILHVPINDPHVMAKAIAAWKAKRKFLTIEIQGQELNEYNELRNSFLKTKVHFPEDIWIVNLVFFSNGWLSFSSNKNMPDEAVEQLKRFAGVFDLTYTRFKDLKQAEAQSREAQIELALERVRARTMAMKHSEELQETSLILFEQLKELGEPAEQCTIGIILESEGVVEISATLHGNNMRQTFRHRLDEPFVMTKMFKGWKDHQRTLVLEIKDEELQKYNQYRNELTGKETFPVKLLPGDQWIIHIAYFSKGMLALSTNKPRPAESLQLLERFAIVFEQTYTRFLDLQKAEAQAREAEIQLALERVRAKSLAMHHTSELQEIVHVVAQQLQQIGVNSNGGVFITINKEVEQHLQLWASSGMADYVEKVYIPVLDKPIFIELWEAIKKGNSFFDKAYSKEEKDAMFRHLFQFSLWNLLPPERKEELLSREGGLTRTAAISQNTSVVITNHNGKRFSEGEIDILKRFGYVFEQAYTRFLDLQKAEAQAKEAKIEMALEKIRARTMAMQHSDEIPEAANLLFLEVQALGIPAWSCGYNVLAEDKKTSDCWMSSEGAIQAPFTLYFTEEVSFLQWHDFLQSDESFFVQELGGKELVHHYDYMRRIPKLGEVIKALEDAGISLPTYQINHLCKYASGFLLFITYEPVPDAHEIFKRFTKVFEQTYTRFLDLQKAEAQAREARIETALERVRARALAMQEPEELIEVAEVLRHEMGLLGVEELETCSIFINDVQVEKAECWFALKDIHSTEKKLVSDHFALDLKDTWVGREMLQFYNSPKIQTSVAMQGANRKEWIRYCENKSVPFRGYYGEVIPDRTYHLYKFSHGAIGAAAVADISEESWRLLKRAASVFSLAYSRFKDLTQVRTDLVKLKVEKKRAEDALTELQATQKQLVQSEKMASLGELTAGIAHEIQNPLNFVNNFSELSKELLDEMRTELDNGNTEEAKEIANDVIQNLEKITHHGKRADAIVKGMLQHSRSSTGQMEETDINALADEYLRLAYHGLRAKEKTFNASMKTEFDENAGKINVVTQEIGRVILNLITNAFYAVNERKKLNEEGYQPTVTVSTKKENDRIEIRVKDNGTGIPKKVVDKIFQPFFTTKPTGQGTGLGLSLSYDIIKSHGGELKVETMEGKGSEFVILLPI